MTRVAADRSVGAQYARTCGELQLFAFYVTLRDTSIVRTSTTTSIDEAASYIHRGGIVAFPTETVYGLGANVFNADAVAKIFKAKSRPGDNPLIAHIARIEQVAELASVMTDDARRLIDAFFPGPLTVVLPKTDKVPLIATAGLDTIGVRMPRSPIAHQFLLACGMPVVAPSANLSGRPSPTTWQAVAEDLDGRIDCILKGDATEIGLESTVVDCSGDIPVLLRQGSISAEQLRSVLPAIAGLNPVPGEIIRSPGLKHKHYSPRATVIIVEAVPADAHRETSAFIGHRKNAATNRFSVALYCESVDVYARSLFEFFRDCDRHGIERIYCEAVDENGIGAALMDRLRRAAAG